MMRTTITGLTFLPRRDEAFTDPRGITHEALTTNHWVGVVALCGRLRDPAVIVENKTLMKVRAYASVRSPEGVDCMSCLVARAHLDSLVDEEPRDPDQPDGMITIDLRITSWA